MKLVKLVYILDRMSVERRGLPVVGGEYFSMKNGPVTSEVLDLINAGQFDVEETQAWKQCIEDRHGHEVRLLAVPQRLHTSDGELAFLQQVWEEHGAKNEWELRDWCHANCPEWTPLKAGRRLLRMESMGQAVGRSKEQIERTRAEAHAQAEFQALFS